MAWVHIDSGNGLLLHSSAGIITRRSEDANQWSKVDNCIYRIASILTRIHWVQHSFQMKKSSHGPLAKYAKLRVAHAPGMPRTYSPPPRVIDPNPRVTLYTAGHLHTAVPHCSHSRAPIVHTAVPRENNEHGCVYLRCRAVCKLPGCVESHPCNRHASRYVRDASAVMHAGIAN